jgi:hypothetical protein
MFSFAYGYPVTGADAEEADADSTRVFRFKVPVKAPAARPRALRSEPPSRWESVLTRSLNSLHPHARMRFADPFLLRAPLGRRRSLRGLGLRTPVGLMLALDPVLPGGQRCADCPSAAECAGDAFSYSSLNRLVKEGHALGVRLFFCLARDPLVYRQEILDLALRYADCAFLLLSPRAVSEEGFLRDLAEAGNAGLVLSIDGFELETDALHGSGAYAACNRAMKSARETGLPFGFAACYYNGNSPSVFSRGFLEGLIEGGALFGLYYPCPGRFPVRQLHPTALQLRNTGLRIQSARERYPISLVDLRQDVTFRCLEAREGLPMHWVGAGLRHLTLLESLELAALGPRLAPGQPARRRGCPLRKDPQWAKTALGASLADPQGRAFFSFGERS